MKAIYRIIKCLIIFVIIMLITCDKTSSGNRQNKIAKSIEVFYSNGPEVYDSINCCPVMPYIICINYPDSVCRYNVYRRETNVDTTSYIDKRCIYFEIHKNGFDNRKTISFMAMSGYYEHAIVGALYRSPKTGRMYDYTEHCYLSDPVITDSTSCGQDSLFYWYEYKKDDVYMRFQIYHGNPGVRFDFIGDTAYKDIVDHIFKNMELIKINCK